MSTISKPKIVPQAPKKIVRGQPIKRPVPKPVTKPVSKPQSVPTSKPQPVPISTPQPVPISKPQPVPTSKPQPVPISTPQPVPTSKPQSVPTSKPQQVPISTPQPVPISTPKPRPRPVNKVKSTKPNISPALGQAQNLQEPVQGKPVQEQVLGSNITDSKNELDKNPALGQTHESSELGKQQVQEPVQEKPVQEQVLESNITDTAPVQVQNSSKNQILDQAQDQARAIVEQNEPEKESDRELEIKSVNDGQSKEDKIEELTIQQVEEAIKELKEETEEGTLFKKIKKCYTINLEERKDRWEKTVGEIKKLQSKVPDLESIREDAIKDALNPKYGLNQTITRIIKNAKEQGDEMVLFTEDDIEILSINKLLACLEIKNIPKDWDVLSAGSYQSRNIKPVNEHYATTESFCSMHFMIIKNTMYDYFLGNNKCQESKHIDRWLEDIMRRHRKKYYLMNPMPVRQYAGFSNLRKTNVDDNKRKGLNWHKKDC